MKKVMIAGLAVASSAALAQSTVKMDAPTVYGKINKSMSYTNQDVKSRKSFSNVRDVDNSETRLGVKGNMDADLFKASYALEVGLNSSNDSDTTKGRIRMRLAEVKFDSKFGTVAVGQTYTPISKKALTLDPLSNTIFGTAHSDQRALVANSQVFGKGGLGTIYRARLDLISYTTPSFAGITYSISTDRDNKMSNNPASASYGATAYEHMLDFNHKFGETSLNAFVAYQTTSNADEKDNTDLFYGVKVGFMNFDVAFSMTNSEVETATKQKIDKMIGSLAYKMNAHKVAFTYQTAEDDGANPKIEVSQYALGYKYAVNSNLELRATAGMYNVEQTGNNNDSTIVALGTEFKF